MDILLGTSVKYVELSELQNEIRERIGDVERWVRVEIDSHSQSGGHHYFGLIEKSPAGEELARARGIIWRYNAGIIRLFYSATGKSLDAGVSVVVLASVNYDPRYGLSLIIKDIDESYSVGQRELEKQETVRRLAESGLMERQKALEMPFLPGRIAVISSSEAAGYGDFLKHLSGNRYGFSYDFSLFHSLMQGDGAPFSIIGSIKEICEEGTYDLILILRGGGAESDLFCYDDFELCRTIAESPLPVLTAIGHERDYHVADMVAREHFKTPTALADHLVDWVCSIEEENVLSPLQEIISRISLRIASADADMAALVSDIRFAAGSRLDSCDHAVALLEAGIKASDPRRLLEQGYVLAMDKKGNVLKNARSASVGDEFSLRFRDGAWNCTVNEINTEKI